MSYRSDAKRRIWAALPARAAAPTAAPPVPQPPLDAAKKERRLDILALLSLVVAALATMASIGQTMLTVQQSDVPYRTLIFQEQVERTIEANDVMKSSKSSIDRWEVMFAADRMDQTEIQGEIETKMLAFAELAPKAWLISPESQDTIGAAAASFNRYAAQCLIPTYVNGNPGDEETTECGGMRDRYEETLKAASDSIEKAIRFQERQSASKTRGLPLVK